MKSMQTISSKNEGFGQRGKTIRKKIIILSLKGQKAWMASENYLPRYVEYGKKMEQNKWSFLDSKVN